MKIMKGKKNWRNQINSEIKRHIIDYSKIINDEREVEEYEEEEKERNYKE